MSIKNLDHLFNPQRIAVIGASENDKSVGYHIFKNLIGRGYKGIVHPINPTMRGVQGVEAYKSIGDIPHPIDLAMVATDPENLQAALSECGEKGVKSVIILAPDYKFRINHAYHISDQIKKLSSMQGCRILGPNSLGILRPGINLNASLYPEMPEKGNIAFISESGLFSSAFLEHAKKKKVGFSFFISLGFKLDINFSDIIDYLGRDSNTKAIFLHIQEIHNGRRFMAAIRNYAKLKPIVVVKPGKADSITMMTTTDRGSLAEDDLIYDAVFKRAGSLRVNNIIDLLDVVETIAKQNRPKGPRLMIIANSITPSDMAIDALQTMGGLMATPGRNTLATINKHFALKRRLKNPLHLLADATPADYQAAISTCLQDNDIDGVLIISTPFPGINPESIAEAIVSATSNNTTTPIFTTWCGEESGLTAISQLTSKGIPIFNTPEQAVKSFMYMYRYDYNLKLLQETPETLLEGFVPDLEKAEKIIRDCLKHNRFSLHPNEAGDILRSYGIPVVASCKVDNAEEAVIASRRLGFPVVMKIESANSWTSYQQGSVVKNLKNDIQVRDAFDSLKELLDSRRERKLSIIVQPPVESSGYELMVGAQKSRSFGTVILFGLGGKLLRAEKDYSIGLPPLNQTLAKRMMEETKIYNYLQGIPSFHNALNYLEEMLVRFSQLLIDLPQIDEIALNPLFLTEQTGVVLDVAIHLDEKLPLEYRWTKGDLCPLHLCIPPYPFKYEKKIILRDGTCINIRPIRGEDEPLMRLFFETLSEESLFFRFGLRRVNMPHVYLARFCQVDYDRDLAFLAVAEGKEGVIIGDVRLNRLSDLETAELSFAVADEWQKRGIGSILMEYCLAVASEIGLKTLLMEIIKDNWRMLKFGQKYFFKRLPSAEADDLVEMVLTLPRTDELAPEGAISHGHGKSY